MERNKFQWSVVIITGLVNCSRFQLRVIFTFMGPYRDDISDFPLRSYPFRIPSRISVHPQTTKVYGDACYSSVENNV
jgi:hypothetical protein